MGGIEGESGGGGFLHFGIPQAARLDFRADFRRKSLHFLLQVESGTEFGHPTKSLRSESTKLEYPESERMIKDHIEVRTKRKREIRTKME